MDVHSLGLRLSPFDSQPWIEKSLQIARQVQFGCNGRLSFSLAPHDPELIPQHTGSPNWKLQLQIYDTQRLPGRVSKSGQHFPLPASLGS